MANNLPETLKNFLRNGLEDCDDGFEYSSEFHRILNSEGCQASLSDKQMENLREFAEACRKVGEFNYYSRERVRELERERFGSAGISGYLGVDGQSDTRSGLLDLFK